MATKHITFNQIINKFHWSIMTLAFTGIYLFLCIDYNIPDMHWYLPEIDSPISNFLMIFGVQKVSMIWITLIAGSCVFGILALFYWAGKRYASKGIRFSLMAAFLLIELIGVPASELGGSDGNGTYVWSNTYSYSSYQWVMQTNLTSFIMDVSTEDYNNDGSADYPYIGIIFGALLVSLFPHGWVIGLFMLLCAMYWSCWSNDFLPTILTWIFRNNVYE